MIGGGTRRAFLGAGVAAAAGAGLTRLPKALSSDASRARASLSLETRDLTIAGAAPAFGSLRPSGGHDGTAHGTLHDRTSHLQAGSVSITSITTNAGMLRVHTLDLHRGTLVAIGNERDTAFRVSSGTGDYAHARGSVTPKNAARAAIHFDIELEL